MYAQGLTDAHASTLLLVGKILENQQKVNYLNVGCGAKFHVAWTNVDMTSVSPHVQAHNLLKGFPYADNTFDVLYHSQVLEHFPKDRAPSFMRECMRVLRPGGTIRVVVPDLEDVVREYIRLLEENINDPKGSSAENYNWIVMELLDQLTRNKSGGQMKTFLAQPDIRNEDYIVSRIGRIGRDMIASGKNKPSRASDHLRYNIQRARAVSWRRLVGYCTNWLIGQIGGEAVRVGRFRTGGEAHLWMYDRYSLGRLLLDTGFESVTVLDAHRSTVADWGRYELDVRNGVVLDPNSLFVEALKPVQQGTG